MNRTFKEETRINKIKVLKRKNKESRSTIKKRRIIMKIREEETKRRTR